MKYEKFIITTNYGKHNLFMYNYEKRDTSSPSKKPSEAQLKQIERKYGMFIHFGINTFHGMETQPKGKN